MASVMAETELGTVVASQIINESTNGDRFLLALTNMYDEYSIIAVNLKTSHVFVFVPSQDIPSVQDLPIKIKREINFIELFKIASNFIEKPKELESFFYICSLKLLTQSSNLMVEIREKRTLDATAR